MQSQERVADQINSTEETRSLASAPGLESFTDIEAVVSQPRVRRLRLTLWSAEVKRDCAILLLTLNGACQQRLTARVSTFLHPPSRRSQR